MDIQYLISLWLIAIIILSFINIKWASCFFLAHSMLVPVVSIRMGGFVLGEIYIRSIFLIGFFYNVVKKEKRVEIGPLMPFLIFLLLNLILIPFQDGMSHIEMLDRWRKDFMYWMFFPFVLWNIMRNDKESVRLYRNTMLIVIAISICYGLFLTTLKGINPYMIYLSSIMNSDTDYFENYYAITSGRLFGRISSVFLHPMSFALFIGLSFVFLWHFRKETNRYVFISLLFITGLMALFCGVRSVLGGLFGIWLYNLYVSHNYKVFLYSIIIIIVSWGIIYMLPGLDSYIMSMLDVTRNSKSVEGSSLYMRYSQLCGAIDIASSNPLFGMGYGWTSYYMDMYISHPVCLTFESLLFVIICNSGMAGFILWSFLIVFFFRTIERLNIKGKYGLYSLFLFYLVYSTITGEYGYMKIFIIFYILMLGGSVEAKKNRIWRNFLFLSKYHRQPEKETTYVHDTI